MEGQDVKKDRLTELEELLTEYTEKKLLLGKIKMTDVALDLTTSDLAAMSSEDLNNWRFDIAIYLTHLQKEINRHKSRANWANKALTVYLNLKAIDYKGWGLEERRAQAMQHDNYAKGLNKLYLEAQATVDRLEYLPTRISSMSDIAKDMIWARRERYNAEKNHGS